MKRRYHVGTSADPRELSRWLNNLADEPIPGEPAPVPFRPEDGRDLRIEGTSASPMRGEYGDHLVVTVICSRLEAEGEEEEP